MYERQLCPPFSSRSFMNSYGFTSFTTRAPTCPRFTDPTAPQSTVRGQGSGVSGQQEKLEANTQHRYVEGAGAGEMAKMVAMIAAAAAPPKDALNIL